LEENDRTKLPAASEGDTATDIELTEEERQVIELLRTPKLSIKYLDEPTRQRIRTVMQELHHKRGVSLTDVAKLIGNKTSGYTSWLTRQLGVQPREFEEARLAGIHRKVRKYERRPFDGTDPDKAYLLGLRHGDLSVSRPFGDAIRVSTSTTHPAMVKLFTALFSSYGHVYLHPRYKKDTKTYEWNLSTILDSSFEFLLGERDRRREWIASKDSRILSYLAGLVDAEGHIGVYSNKRTTAITVTIYNTDTGLLRFVHKCLTQLGYKPLALYLDKRKDTESGKYHIKRKQDYWRVVVAIFENSQSLLRRLPLRHREKVERKELALSIAKGERWEDVRSRVRHLQDSLRSERLQYTKQAELEFRLTHSEREI
jgi:hypothetical protein